MAATGRSVNRAAISADLSSALRRTDSGGKPNASAATFAVLAAAAAAAAVVLFASSKAAKATREAAETVLVFMQFSDSGFAGIPRQGSEATASDRQTICDSHLIVKFKLQQRKGPEFPPGLCLNLPTTDITARPARPAKPLRSCDRDRSPASISERSAAHNGQPIPTVRTRDRSDKRGFPRCAHTEF